jgi:hypothetical protein
MCSTLVHAKCVLDELSGTWPNISFRTHHIERTAWDTANLMNVLGPKPQNLLSLKTLGKSTLLIVHELNFRFSFSISYI